MKPFIIYPPNPRICPGEDNKCSHIYHAFINHAHQARAAGEPCCFEQSDAEFLMELFIIKQKPKWNMH